MSKKLNVVYMGTPGFAVGPLQAILQSDHTISAVVTVPDKPAGRGRKLSMSAVKEFALENNLRVLQPEKLRDQEFIQTLKDLAPDVMVVVAFRMLPEMVWQLPKIGTFNLHASLLPQYRGAAPINWAIINGEEKTGVTTFFINEAIDEGAILMQREVAIAANETAGTLHDKLMEVGSTLVVETLDGLATGTLKPYKQPQTGEFTSAPKIFKDDCRINWVQKGIEIERHIRGLSPYPAAFTTIASGDNTGNIKISSAKFVQSKHELPLASLHVIGKEIHVFVRDGYLKIEQLQPEGKRNMSASDFINGLRNKTEAMQLA